MRPYDSKIDASAIAAASVTGGLTASTGVADVGVRFGDYTEVDTTSLSVVSNNRFAKTGFLKYFQFLWWWWPDSDPWLCRSYTNPEFSRCLWRSRRCLCFGVPHNQGSEH